MELTALHNMNVILSDNPAASHFLLFVPLALFHQSRTHVGLTLIFKLSSKKKRPNLSHRPKVAVECHEYDGKFNAPDSEVRCLDGLYTCKCGELQIYQARNIAVFSRALCSSAWRMKLDGSSLLSAERHENDYCQWQNRGKLSALANCNDFQVVSFMVPSLFSHRLYSDFVTNVSFQAQV